MIITFGGDKGGTGKTTLSACMVVCLAQQGKSVVLVKTDNNDNLSDWYEQRKENNLPLFPMVTLFGNISKELRTTSVRADVTVVDTAGYDSPEFRSALSVSDWLLSPIRPSSPTEVNSLSKLQNIWQQSLRLNPKLRARILFNRCEFYGNADRIALAKHLKSDADWIPPCITFISASSAFDAAIADGRGIHESNKRNASKGKAQVELLINELGI